MQGSEAQCLMSGSPVVMPMKLSSVEPGDHPHRPLPPLLSPHTHTPTWTSQESTGQKATLIYRLRAPAMESVCLPSDLISTLTELWAKSQTSLFLCCKTRGHHDTSVLALS